jgi:hypothetical protein
VREPCSKIYLTEGGSTVMETSRAATIPLKLHLLTQQKVSSVCLIYMSVVLGIDITGNSKGITRKFGEK